MELKDIPDRLRLLRRSQADLARFLDLDPSSLTKTIKGERRVQPHELPKLETFFGERLELTATAPMATRRRPPSKIPLFGYAAAGGEDRIALADDRVLDELEPPPFWSGSGELIYVRLVGDSMEPRYFSGEIVPVRLNVWPAKNGDCLIEFTDHTAVVKTYDHQGAGKIFVRQYNEPRLIPYEATSIRALHAIWKPGML